MKAVAWTAVLAFALVVAAATATTATADPPVAPTTPAPAIPAPTTPAPAPPKPFVCVFLHGYAFAGPGTRSANRTVDPQYARGSLPFYWGSVHKRVAPVCTRVVTYFTETQKRGWQNPTLIKEYCDVLAVHNADVVFTHSMASQVVAAGIDARVPGCDRIGTGVDAVHWYGMQGPMRGSPMASVAGKLCRNPLVGPIIKLIVKACDGNVKSGWKAGEGLRSIMPESCPAKWTEVAAAHVSGSMCGAVTANTKVTTDAPLTGAMKLRDQIGLTLGAKLTGHDFPALKDWNADLRADASYTPEYATDGMVGYESCRVAPREQYRKDPAAPHYLLDGNHADGTCRYGESKGGKRKNFMPCSWIVNMARRSRALKQPGFEAARFAAVDEVVADAAEDEAVEDAAEFGAVDADAFPASLASVEESLRSLSALTNDALTVDALSQALSDAVGADADSEDEDADEEVEEEMDADA